MGDLKLFINRKNELSFLNQDIKSHEVRARLLVISANTGIGKSALVDQAISAFTNEDFRISLSIDKNGEIQDGHLIKLITSVLHKNAIKNGNHLSIYAFIKADRFYKNVANGLWKVILKYIGLDDFADGFKTKNTTVTDSLKSWLGDDNELLDICHRYISYVTSVRRLFLTIENLQIVDRRSLSILRNILKESSNVYVVGEYTTDENTGENLYSCLNFFDSENISVNNLRIEKLDKEELINSIKDEKELLISIIESTYINSDGNLHKFKLLRNTSHLKSYNVNLSSYNNITRHLLNSLDDISITIVSIIQAHKGEVSTELFDFYLNYSPSFQFISEHGYQGKLIDLKELGLLNVSLKKITLQHDSISQDMESISKIKKTQVIAIRNWIRTYQYIERNNLTYEIDYIDNLLWQLYFLLKIEAFDETVEILEKLNKYISVSPTYTIILYLDKIANAYKNFSEEINIELFRWLIIMYYRCGYSDRIIDLATPTLNRDPIILLCTLAALSTVNSEHVLMQIAGMSFYEVYLSLGLILIEIRALRSAYKYEECKKLWLEHYHKGTFKGTYFEAGFLKYCTLAIPNDLIFRISCLKKAMNLFHSIGDQHGQISSAIAISRDYAHVGNFEDAVKFLKKAEDLANMAVFPRYQLYNNRAVLDILTDNISQITKDALSNSLRICTNEGDRLIIQANMLALAIVEKNYIYGFTVYNKLQKTLLRNFKETSDLTQVCLYNCYRYSLMIEDTEQANYLKTFLVRMHTQEDPKLWNYLLFDLGQNDYANVVRKDYYPVFIIDWEVDYYAALSSSRQEGGVHL